MSGIDFIRDPVSGELAIVYPQKASNACMHKGDVAWRLFVDAVAEAKLREVLNLPRIETPSTAVQHSPDAYIPGELDDGA